MHFTTQWVTWQHTLPVTRYASSEILRSLLCKRFGISYEAMPSLRSATGQGEVGGTGHPVGDPWHYGWYSGDAAVPAQAPATGAANIVKDVAREKNSYEKEAAVASWETPTRCKNSETGKMLHPPHLRPHYPLKVVQTSWWDWTDIYMATSSGGSPLWRRGTEYRCSGNCGAPPRCHHLVWSFRLVGVWHS